MAITITIEEAKAILAMLRTNWAPLEYQDIIYKLVNRLEKELGN